MKHTDQPFFVWRDRMSALHCRCALLFTQGNQRQAARLIGLDRSTFNKTIHRDNRMLDARARAEGWSPPPD